ncbi:SDR family oxidoreductase, partial [Pseudomonas aeruginosa]|nr:SDR family oxidoreductase [Pseudomonas aeruginosa]HCE8189056.1 SDR family oxidoreductase [Pseudomonas aeruginosa]HCP6250575.1 SDR family oxidoreductase [Pseudomonas aeruginosa]
RRLRTERRDAVFDPRRQLRIHLAWTLSAELLEHGIRVNALSPGPTRTPALDKAATDLEAAQALREKIGRDAWGSRWRLPVPRYSWPRTSPAAGMARRSWWMAAYAT